MAPVPSDYTIVGTVLALAVAILLLSGLALYVAFRVRETLREERGGGARAAKVAFLIGLLFLSGGVFYFFASGFSAFGGSGQTLSTVSTTSSATPLSSVTSSTSVSSSASTTSSGSAVTSTSASTSTTTSASTTTSPTTSTSSVAGQVTISVQCPSSGSSVTAGSTFTCNATIYDLGSTVYQSATLVSSGDLSQFTFLSCSETINGVSATCNVVSGGEIAVGSINPGTTSVTITVQAPSSAGQKNCVLTLAAPGMPQPIPNSFTIQVTNRP